MSELSIGKALQKYPRVGDGACPLWTPCQERLALYHLSRTRRGCQKSEWLRL